MPWAIHIDPTVNCAFVRLDQDFELGGMGVVIEELVNRSDFQIGMNILRDSRGQTIPREITFKAISDQSRRVTAERDRKLGVCKMAVVLGDAQSYAKVHQFIVTGRLSRNPVERKPFRDIKKALAWLGIPEGYEIDYPSPGEAA